MKPGTIKVVLSGLGRYSAFCEEVGGSLSFGDTRAEAIDKARAIARKAGYDAAAPPEHTPIKKTTKVKKS